MNKLQRAAELLNALRDKISAVKSAEAVESCPISRLKQIESRSRDVAAAIAGARLAVIPGTHLIPIEAPQAVNAVIVQFLGGE